MSNAIAGLIAGLLILLSGCVTSSQQTNLEPWSSWKHGNLEFRNYRDSGRTWTHKVVTCRTLSGIRFCN